MSTRFITPFAFLSAVLLPWPLTAFLALSAGVCEPLVPLAIGLFIDVLYYSNAAGLPWATILGALATVLLYLVRSQLRTRTL